MNIQLAKASVEDKPILSNLLELYLYEFTTIEDLKLNVDGRFGYKYLDNYWQEPNRHPFLIRVDGELAGFVFVDEKDKKAYLGYPLGITEFFVMRRYRNKGVGEEIARQIFDMFPGRWSIRQMTNNTDGHKFWSKVIDRYTNGKFKEIESDDENWKGPIQLFDNSK